MKHKDSDDELTPPEVFEPILEAIGETRFVVDVASHPQSLVPAVTRWYGPHRDSVDGLAAIWPGGVKFVQPPYSNASPWIVKASASRSVLLVNATTDTAAWHEHVFPRAVCIVWVRGRIKFRSPHNPSRTAPAKRPSAVVFFDLEPIHLGPLERLGRLCAP